MVTLEGVLKHLDAFAVPETEYRKRTVCGAIVSLLSLLLIFLLLVSEFYYYMTPEVKDHLVVDSDVASGVVAHFDITFPRIGCSLLSIDAVDAAGLPMHNTEYKVFKTKLSAEGKEIADSTHQERGGETLKTEADLHNLHQDTNSPSGGACGDCYGAGEEDECCNSCLQVRLAYQKKGWSFDPKSVKQCEKTLALQEESLKSQEGCRIHGSIDMKSSSGHFHIAPRRGAHETGGGATNFLELISFTYDQFNITHTINSLSFGDHFPGIKSPLDGEHRKVMDVHGMYQYYVKIVPTTYTYISGKTVVSNQYSVTEHLRHLTPGSGRGLPGLYFFYDISPIQADFVETRKGFTHFLTSVCALIGGVYVVMGLFDALFDWLFKALRINLDQYNLG